MKADRRKRRGFSLAEMLLAVAILLILFGLGIPNLFRMQRSLRQKELDSKAEIIYIAAQNKMTKLRTSGNSSKYYDPEGHSHPESGTKEIEDGLDNDGTPVSVELSYMSYTDLANAAKAAGAVMEPGTVDEELYNNQWVIEYLPEAGMVYGVFYSENAEKEDLRDYASAFSTRYSPTATSTLRLRQNRMKAGAWIGYYGYSSGGTASDLVEAKTISPTITVTNEEKLTALLKCSAPAEVDDLSFTFTMSDNAGHTYREVFTTTNGLLKWGRTYYILLTLDDLSSAATRFYNAYGEGSDHADKLLSGTPLHLTLQVSSRDNLIETSRVVTADTNSLFADSSTAELAEVKYARHLQNLDVDSHREDSITEARQIADLSFAEDTSNDRDWFTYYSTGGFYNGKSAGEANFRPIRNDNLTQYDGNGFKIAALNVERTGSAGLFETGHAGMTYKDVTLTGARVRGDSVGALVGSVAGTGVTMDQCRVYLEPSNGDLEGKTEQDLWLSGSVTGGLTGTVESGASLTVRDSFASTVLKGTGRAGGLAGVVADGGTLNLETSYADSYIYGQYTGALAGGGTVASITDCYAAGFQTAEVSTAGLVNGTITDARRSYTIAAMEQTAVEEGEPALAPLTVYSTAAGVGNAERVYYMTGGSELVYNLTGTEQIGARSSADLAALLMHGTDNAFTTDTASTTVPYNLMGQTLDSYTYPRLKVNHHYGDWQADFQPGSLVYYEKYRDEDGGHSYGFYGANVDSTLSEEGTIVGDGYGIIYKNTDTLPDKLTVKLGERTLELDLNQTAPTATEGTGADAVTYAIQLCEATDAEGQRYWIYTLPMEIVNAEATEAFYQRVEITAKNTVNHTETKEFFFYNPHFAKTVGRLQSAEEQIPQTPMNDRVYVRSPRHLYAMSLYYDRYYLDNTASAVFQQERNISFTGYDWQHFYREAPDDVIDQWPKNSSGLPHANSESSYVIDAQQPIGADSTTPFRAVYDGGCYTITDVSFKSDAGSFIGMFGYSVGTLRNVVLATEYNPDSDERYLVQRIQNMEANDHIYMGVLAGLNADSGLVNNCAVAGYYVAGMDGTIHAYDNSKIYVGGLVGANDGTVRNSAADCPAIRVSTVFAEGYIGGFVGHNRSSGVISNSYSIGHVEVAYARGGSVSIAGFAGRNNGTLSNDYCAVSLVSSGDVVSSHGFAAKGGSVTGCRYLDQGTYTYVDQLRSYNTEASDTSGASTTYKELTRQQGSTAPGRDYSLCHPNTGDNKSRFPFRAVVRDRSGHYVHYGDWQLEPVLGSLGIFYWEREQYGANDGYHFTYIGTVEGKRDYGSSLCTAHDDEGVITEYGYGYYVQIGQEENVKLTSSGISVSGGGGYNAPGNYDENAARELQIQMPEYQFYPYTTRVADSGCYVYLNNGTEREGTWTLTYNGSEGEKTYHYKLAPFFANAMWRSDSGVGSITVTASDGRPSDYSAAAGSEQNTYEVRSVEQLQYINWNCDSMDCTSLVFGRKDGTSATSFGVPNSGNYQKFPYLQYATVLDDGRVNGQIVNVQKRSDVEAIRPPQYWVQTHDLDGGDVDDYTPIAGMATSSVVSGGDNTNILFTWFGGSYDGQSYKIQDLDVVSEAYTVGVFGVTAGASMKDIILYSPDGDNVVERNTLGRSRTFTDSSGSTTVNFEKAQGAYNIGGLVGIGYEYSSTNITNKLENCSIAGYQIIDRSTNQMGAGTGNMGGLIGLANLNLERCSAVTDILIDCTHENGHMYWGSYLRVGGLAGSAGAPGSALYVRNSYTGGSVTLSERSMKEKPTKFDSDGYAYRDTGGKGCSFNVFVSGMVGGAYAPNISNFTGQISNSPDGTANISNCYTYLRLPDLKGTVRAVSLFANQGDRYGRASKITVTNCYYLSSIKDTIQRPHQEDPTTWPDYFFQAAKDRNGGEKAPTQAELDQLHADTASPELINKYKNLIITDEEFENMLNGDLGKGGTNDGLHTLLKKQGDKKQPAPPDPATGVSYSELSSDSMPGSLSIVWGKVTITEGPRNARIDGKYSFPSANHLEGKNYPFPTVIQQNDLTYGTYTKPVWVNVHYGAWPVEGMYWHNARDSMDIFADMKDSGYSEKVFILHEKGLLNGKTLEPEDFAVDGPPDNVVEIQRVEYDAAKQQYAVTIRAVRTGAVTVRLDDEAADSPSFVLEVTADLKVEVLPSAVEGYKNTPAEVQLQATSRQISGSEPNVFSLDANGTWSLAAVESEDAELFECVQNANNPSLWTVTCYQPGTRTLEAVFRYDYWGREYTAANFLEVKTFGVVGILDDVGYSELNRSETGGQGESPRPIVSYPYETAPALPDGMDLALYGTVNEGLLTGGSIVLKVNDSPVDGTGLTENGFRVMRGELTKDSAFEYIGLKVTYVGQTDALPVEVVLTAEITDPRSTEGNPIVYTFQAELDHVRLHEAQFAGGSGAYGEMESLCTYTDQPEITMPDCAFEKDGYRFDYWTMDGDAEQTHYPKGAPVTLTSDCTFTAQWTPITYQIRFDPNCTGYTGAMENQSFAYNTAQALTPCGYVREGWYFDGWNTKTNGNGTAYADEASVENLTEQDGDVIVLYAQWVTDTLTLSWSGGTSAYIGGDLAGQSAIHGYTMPQRADGTVGDYTCTYELMGWYTASDGTGVKVLDATGTVCAENVSGIVQEGVFALEDDCTLYALWEEHIWLRKEFSPNGTDWSDPVQGVSFADGDYLEAVVDLSSVTVKKQNIISFGQTINKYEKEEDNPSLHLYYKDNGGKNRLRAFMNDMGSMNISGKVRIRFSNNEYKVYNEAGDELLNVETVTLTGNNDHQRAYSDQRTASINLVRNLDTIDVGSKQGNVRSTAYYEYIKFVRVDIYD